MEIYWFKTNDCLLNDLESQLHLLNDDEKEKYDSYLLKSKKTEYLIGRVIIKTVIGRILGCLPEEVVIKKGDYGKPYVEGIERHFNLSHTSGMVVCAFSDRPVGLDVEKIASPPYEIMRKVFGQTEIDFVENMPDEKSRREAFYLVWTRKESVLKGLGKGFAIHPGKLVVPTNWREASYGEFRLTSFIFQSDYMISFALKTCRTNVHYVLKDFVMTSGLKSATTFDSLTSGLSKTEERPAWTG